MSLSTWIDTLRSQRYSLLPTNSVPTSPEPIKHTSTKKRLFQTTLVALVLMGIIGYSLKSVKTVTIEEEPIEFQESQPIIGDTDTAKPLDPPDFDVGSEIPPDSVEIPSTSTSTDSEADVDVEVDTEAWRAAGNWGVSEDLGWISPPYNSSVLGEVAEGRYRLGFSAGETGSREYFQRLHDFALSLPEPLHTPLLSSLFYHSPPNYENIVSTFYPDQPHSPSMISYKYIHQTDKEYNPENELPKVWESINKPDGWRMNFLDDAQAHNWMLSQFEGSDVNWAWDYMHRGVLKADFLRYLLPLVVGGVYSDVDTRPIRPIEEWGTHSVELLDLSYTDGAEWRSRISTHPAVIVGVDVDVHNKEGWQNEWPRPLGICQWTLSSAPSHPIFLDAVRRVVNSTRVVEAWEEWRIDEIQKLESDGQVEQAEELKGQHRDHAMNVMEWTGPGLFTDSVVAFLLARYNVSWHRLRSLDHPLRIGDVLILPITGFSPGGERDFGAENPDSIQANVLHNFRGSWKGDGARK
ncbi:uncharacterized protein I303_106439 [Kwoniella dejecticola CBS 10117]|uniref:Alpha 1,6-mannosyltransferase n=1 Tax=Kwoniella dejecticola CBS 10117 TaxID=1296121 RepID=A0A1A5ZUP5_9TREE|nr:uncharacterized protein I303_08301 [Kwoniella dejecticola CBS 10117]OBR81531.1 hypothetical protein I303_08301 [Kwoniella dejecticola CBS 10117]